MIWGLEQYIAEATRQLESHHYRKLQSSQVEQVITLIDRTLTNQGLITKSEKKAMTQTDSREAEFYLLPKIHKRMNPPSGRPIMSGNGHPTEWLSAWVDTKLQPLMLNLPSYLKDSTHLLNLLQTVEVSPNSRIVSLDITSLYTNIPHQEGLKAIETVDHLLNPSENYSHVKSLAAIVLQNNIFNFNDDHYIQEQGTAMGTRMAPAYANIFMHSIESVITSANPQIKFWRRFIDDIFCIIDEDRTFQADTLLSAANSVNPNIQFTMESDKSGVAFLDMFTWIQGQSIHTKPYTKPTDRKLYLRYDLCHPGHQKSGIAYSQALRLKRICSQRIHLDQELENLKSNLVKRGHPIRQVNIQIRKTYRIDRTSLLNPTATNRPAPTDSQQVKLITTYTHGLMGIHRIIQDLERKHTIWTNYRICYRRDKNLRDLLVRAKLPGKTQPKIQPINLTLRTVNTNLRPKFCNKDIDDRICISCHIFSLERKFILHRETLHVINKQLTSCRLRHPMPTMQHLGSTHPNDHPPRLNRQSKNTRLLVT